MITAQSSPHLRTDHGRQCAAACRSLLKAEKDPFGRDWNSQTTQEERAFWLRAAGQSACLAPKKWAELPDVTRHALRLALSRVAARASHLLQAAGA